jgi:hypothetical protein
MIGSFAHYQNSPNQVSCGEIAADTVMAYIRQTELPQIVVISHYGEKIPLFLGSHGIDY